MKKTIYICDVCRQDISKFRDNDFDRAEYHEVTQIKISWNGLTKDSGYSTASKRLDLCPHCRNNVLEILELDYQKELIDKNL